MPITPNWHPWKVETKHTTVTHHDTTTLKLAPASVPITTPSEKPTPWVMPDVWHERATGMEWCDCGDHCPLTKRIITDSAEDLLDECPLPDRITHRQVIRIAMDVWNYVSVCRFFTLAIEEAAIRVNGAVADDYPMNVGLAIIKAFSNRWNGCPTEDCPGEWTPDDIDAGTHEGSQSREGER